MFVVGFDRIAARPVFNAYAFASMLQIADDLVLETAVDLAGGRRDSMTQEAHHVQALKVAHGLMHKSWIVPLERLGFFEDHIGGVFALGHRPIIMQSGQGGEDLAMERMSLTQEFLEQLSWSRNPGKNSSPL